MSETIKHHEILRPIREIAQGIGNFVVGKASSIILPPNVISDVFNGVQQESVRRTAEFFQPPLPYDSEGNWHNPDGV